MGGVLLAIAEGRTGTVLELAAGDGCATCEPNPVVASASHGGVLLAIAGGRTGTVLELAAGDGCATRTEPRGSVGESWWGLAGNCRRPHRDGA